MQSIDRMEMQDRFEEKTTENRTEQRNVDYNKVCSFSTIIVKQWPHDIHYIYLLFIIIIHIELLADGNVTWSYITILLSFSLLLCSSHFSVPDIANNMVS